MRKHVVANKQQGALASAFRRSLFPSLAIIVPSARTSQPDNINVVRQDYYRSFCEVIQPATNRDPGLFSTITPVPPSPMIRVFIAP